MKEQEYKDLFDKLQNKELNEEIKQKIISLVENGWSHLNSSTYKYVLQGDTNDPKSNT